MQTELATIFGRHAVGEALRERPDVIVELYLGEGSVDPALMDLIKKFGLKHSPLNPKKVKDLPDGAVHQGVAARIDPTKLQKKYDDFLADLKVTNDTAVIILGEVQDPQNVGSIIRSAAAFGIAAIFVPQHRQAPISGTVVKISAGMAFRIPLVSIVNVNTTISDLKDRGFWIYGLEGEAKQSLYTEGFEKPSAFIIGNEASGIREKTLEHCDIPLRIPMHPQAESLNAAVATAVVLSEWSKKHPGALG